MKSHRLFGACHNPKRGEFSLSSVQRKSDAVPDPLEFIKDEELRNRIALRMMSGPDENIAVLPHKFQEKYNSQDNWTCTQEDWEYLLREWSNLEKIGCGLDYCSIDEIRALTAEKESLNDG